MAKLPFILEPYRALGLTLIAVGLGAPAIAAADVYKCDLGGGVMYTDVPCAGGRALEIEPGTSNPAALRRLQAARDALNESADRRLAALARDAQRRAESERFATAATQPVPLPSDTDGGYDTDYAYGPVWYQPVVRRHPHPPRHGRPPAAGRHSAPTPPYIVPRS